MKILLNGEPDPRPDDETIAQLLEALGLAGSPCAVEVNLAIVPKSEHAERRLAEGDAVEIVTLVGGG